MSLVDRLPGGEAMWLCAPDSVCTWSPLVLFGLGCLVLSQVSKMSAMCGQFLSIFAVGTIMFDKLGMALPGMLVQGLGFVILAIHVPMLNKKQSTILMVIVAALVGGSFTGNDTNVKLAMSAIALVILLHRLFLTVLTLLASTPTPLVFGIVSHIMPRWSFSDEQFFRTDDPTDEIGKKRERAYNTLYKKWGKKFKGSTEDSKYLKNKFSDLRFAAGNRVFIPFQKKLEDWCDPCTVVDRVDRMDLIDVDGHRLTDVGGSYGVNVCGYDEYKRFITEGWDAVKEIGCVLGPIHPLIRDNIDMLRRISGKEEVSFHMSGTEAVMCATRLARFNTRRKFLVLFGGAYHGWWDGVQPMAGNERVPTDVLTLKDMNPLSMAVIRARAHEIAAVVINPLQAFHPNSPPPSDLVLASNTRGASDSTKAYKTWLEKMRETCTRLDIPLIFDEVYTGFRLAPGGAQEYFGVQADMVVYGKTLGGGIANGIVCGPRHLMARADPVKPLRVAYVIGTFAAHPLLVGSMNSFLKWVLEKDTTAKYNRLRKDVNEWTGRVNARLDEEFPEEGAPIQIGSYASVWTMLYKRPGRYHWMLQYYLKDEGLNLSWVGTGRLSFSLDFERDDLELLTEKIVKACHRMEDDGWWWVNKGAQPKFVQLKVGLEVVKALSKRALTF